MNILRREGSRLWAAYWLLTLLLGAGVYFFAGQQYNSQRTTLLSAANGHFQIVTSLLTAELKHGHYQVVNQLVQELGADNEDLIVLSVTTVNGFLLGEYRRALDAIDTLELKTEINYSYQGLATVTYRLSLDRLNHYQWKLHLQLWISLLIVAMFLAYVTRLSISRERQAEQLGQLSATLNDQNTRLTQSEKKYRRLVENLREYILFRMNPEGFIYYVTPSVTPILGYSQDEVIGEIQRFITDSPINSKVPKFREISDISSDHQFSFEIEVYGKRGERITLEVVLTAIWEKRKLLSIEGIAHDITEQKRVRDEINLAASVFAESSEGISILDKNGNILRCNEAFLRQTGFSRADLLGTSIATLNSGYQDQIFYQEIFETLNLEKRWQGELVNRRKNGETFPAWVTLTTVPNTTLPADSHIVCIFSDISKIKETQKQIQYLAYHDSLTGLPNRSLLYDRLQQLLHRAKRHKKYSAALFIDLDNFKHVNDKHGHHIGDLLLKATADRLINQIRREDTVARLGGDEFFILLSELGTRRDTAAMDATNLAEKIRQALVKPHILEGINITSTVSIGVALLPETDDSPENIHRRADLAMYKAKTTGRNRVSLYQ